MGIIYKSEDRGQTWTEKIGDFGSVRVIIIDPNNPLSRVSERVDRDIGDTVQVEISDRYSPFKGFDVSALYNFTCKYKNDRVSGDMGLDYSPLEKETAFKSHNIISLK